MKFGPFLMFFAIIFAWAETIYFGGNWTAQSAAEWVCDFLALTLCIFGFILIIKNK